MLKFVIPFVLILLVGCSMNVNSYSPPASNLKQIEVIDTSFEVAKVAYNLTRSTYYIWEKDSPNIHIYRNGKEINTVGGLGFGNENFQRLSDIGIGADGCLYGLDRLLKKLKKYDADGKWLLDYDVSWSQEPTKFALSQSNQLILFDDIQKEFISSSDLRPEESFRFGKFQVSNVKQMSIQDNIIVVFEPEPPQTSLFTFIGEFLSTRQGQIASDLRGNLYRLDKNFVTFIPTEQTAASSEEPYISIFIYDPYLLTTTKNQVQRWLINYAARP